MNQSLSNKEPWVAVNLSYFFPGIGQIYSGNISRGRILIICSCIFWVLGIYSIFHPISNPIIGIAFLLAYSFYLYGIFLMLIDVL